MALPEQTFGRTSLFLQLMKIANAQMVIPLMHGNRCRLQMQAPTVASPIRGQIYRKTIDWHQLSK
ncbi:MAG: hypothetical protein ACRYGG_07940 [Janthinobacterium lividum]